LSVAVSVKRVLRNQILLALNRYELKLEAMLTSLTTHNPYCKQKNTKSLVKAQEIRSKFTTTTEALLTFKPLDCLASKMKKSLLHGWKIHGDPSSI
jgi:hypothetical protein